MAKHLSERNAGNACVGSRNRRAMGRMFVPGHCRSAANTESLDGSVQKGEKHRDHLGYRARNFGIWNAEINAANGDFPQQSAESSNFLGPSANISHGKG